MPLDARGARGADEMASLARTLRIVGDKYLRSDFYRSINRATAPAVPAVKKSILALLPKAGGLNTLIASTTKVRRKTYTGSQRAGIKIFADGQHDIVNLNRGRNRHLVFGHQPWLTQKVERGMFDKPLEALTPEVRHEVEQTMERITRELAGRAHTT